MRTPSRILKGKRMAGRMGHVTNTALNLTIVSSDVENGVLAIKAPFRARRAASFSSVRQ